MCWLRDLFWKKDNYLQSNIFCHTLRAHRDNPQGLAIATGRPEAPVDGHVLSGSHLHRQPHNLLRLGRWFPGDIVVVVSGSGVHIVVVVVTIVVISTRWGLDEMALVLLRRRILVRLVRLCRLHVGTATLADRAGGRIGDGRRRPNGIVTASVE
jgi:hypothetical protein